MNGGATLSVLQHHVQRFAVIRTARPNPVPSRVPPARRPNFARLNKGMSLDVKATRNDMVAQLHLDAVTVQDMARPQDSPFRHMMYTMPDETSHGGLIHVTYWESAGGVRRIPPVWIAETGGQRYDQVVDARISTLQVRHPTLPKHRI